MFRKVNLPILGLVENMSYFICKECKNKHYIFGKQSTQQLTINTGIEVLGEIPISENLSKNYNVNHPIVNNNQSDIVFKSFSDIGQKVWGKIKI